MADMSSVLKKIFPKTGGKEKNAQRKNVVNLRTLEFPRLLIS